MFGCHVNMSVHTCLYLNEMSPSVKIQKSSTRGFMKEVTLKDSMHGCADVEYVREIRLMLVEPAFVLMSKKE